LLQYKLKKGYNFKNLNDLIPSSVQKQKKTQLKKRKKPSKRTKSTSAIVPEVERKEGVNQMILYELAKLQMI